MSRFPDYQFVTKDTSTLQSEVIAMYERITGTTVHPASPEKLFISWVSAALVQAYAITNYVGNQNIPSRANGENLDALGELFYSIERPKAHSAICMEKFAISEPQPFDIHVPKGTRVTDAGRALVWETMQEATIPAGQTSVTTTICCQTLGTVGNGYVAGQLNTIVDVFEYYSYCENLTSTDGGADEATDEEFYELLKASMDAFSTAGPVGAYTYHAKSVSTEIADVKLVCPRRIIDRSIPVYDHHAFLSGNNVNLASIDVNGAVLGVDYTIAMTDGLITIELQKEGKLADVDTIHIRAVADDAGCIDIYALMTDGTPASETVKQLILEACNSDTVRPLTDLVRVKDPDVVRYNVNITYYTSEESTSSAAEVATAVNNAVSEYIAWQAARLGRDINPSKLISMIMSTGVIKRVDVVEPAFTSLQDGSAHNIPQIATVGNILVANGGAEDD